MPGPQWISQPYPTTPCPRCFHSCFCTCCSSAWNALMPAFLPPWQTFTHCKSHQMACPLCRGSGPRPCWRCPACWLSRHTCPFMAPVTLHWNEFACLLPLWSWGWPSKAGAESHPPLSSACSRALPHRTSARKKRTGAGARSKADTANDVFLGQTWFSPSFSGELWTRRQALPARLEPVIQLPWPHWLPWPRSARTLAAATGEGMRDWHGRTSVS